MYFVTGTDTDSGKTLISSALLNLATRKTALAKITVAKTTEAKTTEAKTLGVKPIASGCIETDAGLRNSDALSLIEQSTITLDYNQINPIAFKPAIAPHIAAKQQGVSLTASGIVDLLPLEALNSAEFALIEGAGGWRLPLSKGQYLSQSVQQLAQQNDVGVILVVGMKLGCLNHALLTQEAIEADGLNIAAWVANQVDPEMSEIEENLSSLKELMTAPFLGYVPYLSEPTAINAAVHIDNSTL
ncbi:dethiobiotin synthase [Shewanella sp. 10N.286.48.B5]|uniref:dethiobiotin synthase n=1 Tax=Shewanella sp. 10N.286.48.B5 TaxID=1880834 RepID=UPI000CB56089|nr:dethiobiotin synthase [Shewanella sp. 10N.286.48.B5]PMH87216.1 dethiobiotin synthase [Shewanella sp. 10N.286.48.B5]